MSRQRQNGFTLVELMLALALFSFILIFVLGGFLLITRNYNRGVTSTRIHQAGRNVMEEMVRELRQSSSTPMFQRLNFSSGASQAFICYSGGTYRAWDKATDVGNEGRLSHTTVDLSERCAVGTTDMADGDDIRSDFPGSAEVILNRDEIYVTHLELTQVGNSAELFELDLSLATPNVATSGDLGQADSDGDGLRECSVATSGSEFCDVVSLSTTFSTR